MHHHHHLFIAALIAMATKSPLIFILPLGFVLACAGSALFFCALEVDGRRWMISGSFAMIVIGVVIFHCSVFFLSR